MGVKSPLVMVITGDGKGKTTSAFGQVLRAAGHGFRSLVVQFVKSGFPYGEVTASGHLPGVEVRSMGLGYVDGPHAKEVPLSEHRKAALEALAYCRERAGDVDILVMDEVNFALSKDLITKEEILSFLDERPPELTVILTGRSAPAYLVDRADLVSEIREVKHHYRKGIQAQKGIES